MRVRARMLAVALVAGVTVAVPAAPANADATITVDGYDFIGSGMVYWAERCTNPAAGPASYAIAYPSTDDKKIAGSESPSWRFLGTGDAIGPLGYVASPSTLSVLRTDIRPSAANQTQFRAMAIFDDTAGDFEDGYWIGRSNQVAVIATGITELNAGGTTFNWDHYSFNLNGNLVKDGTAAAATIANFAVSRGTDGSGAYVGYVAGCDGNRFWLDELVTTDATGTNEYHYEQAFNEPSDATLEYQRARAGSPIVFGGSPTIAAGAGLFLLGAGTAYDWWGNPILHSGSGVFSRRTYPATTFSAITTRSFDESFYASYRAFPVRQTVYKYVTKSGLGYLADTSNQLLVKVQTRVRLRVADKSIRVGQRVNVSGRLIPGQGNTVIRLQKRNANGTWSTIGSTRSRAAGGYAVSAPLRSVGTHRIRLAIATNRGVLGKTTRTIFITVKRALPQVSNPVVVNDPAPTPLPTQPPLPGTRALWQSGPWRSIVAGPERPAHCVTVPEKLDELCGR